MDILSNFVETLNELISDNRLTHKDIEKETGISNGNISMWVNNKIAPTLTGLIRISAFFNCSIDYLLFRSNNMSNTDLTLVSTFPIRLKELAKEKKMSLYKVSNELKINNGILYRWARGVVAPNIINLVMLADYFGCSVDYLIGRKQ